jgi:hypothetical protein
VLNFNQFFGIYKEITKECPFSNDPTETFYYNEQDHLKNNLLVNQCIELDISSAFPTICAYVFGKDSPFVKKIYEFDNKFERNKFIAIQLTHNNNLIKDGLKLLNSYCKIIILGYIYNNFSNITIIEYKKDGAVFTGTLNYNKNDEFNNFIEIQMGIIFHIDLINQYIRFNRTSIYNYLNKPLEIKGMYKDCPIYLKEIILPSIFNGEFFNNNELMTNLKKIYTELYYIILYNGELYQDINYYYKFKNKFMQPNSSLDIIQVNPKFILFNFLYPIITLIKA